jgi:hypothetical protein
MLASIAVVTDSLQPYGMLSEEFSVKQMYSVKVPIGCCLDKQVIPPFYPYILYTELGFFVWIIQS